MSTDPRIEAAARALNTAGWTCFGGGMEPGEYDECPDCKKFCDDIATAALAAADKAATITTREQFEALPRGTVVRDYTGQVAERQEDFWANTLSGRDRAAVISFPARVIHWGTE